MKTCDFGIKFHGFSFHKEHTTHLVDEFCIASLPNVFQEIFAEPSLAKRKSPPLNAGADSQRVPPSASDGEEVENDRSCGAGGIGTTGAFGL